MLKRSYFTQSRQKGTRRCQAQVQTWWTICSQQFYNENWMQENFCLTFDPKFWYCPVPIKITVSREKYSSNFRIMVFVSFVFSIFDCKIHTTGICSWFFLWPSQNIWTLFFFKSINFESFLNYIFCLNFSFSWIHIKFNQFGSEFCVLPTASRYKLMAKLLSNQTE